jgi:hypothetical protein
MSLSNDSRVVACDYNPFFIQMANEYFPEIESVLFDFSNSEIAFLNRKCKIDFDMSIFINSAYIMDDPSFIRLFNGLKQIGVKKIINFSTAYLNFEKIMKYYLSPIIKNRTIRKIFQKGPLPNQKDLFHGYARDKWEMRRLYKKSGWNRIEEIVIDACDYVAIIS